MHYINKKTEDNQQNINSIEDYDLYISQDKDDSKLDDEYKDFFEKIQEKEYE